MQSNLPVEVIVPAAAAPINPLLSYMWVWSGVSLGGTTLLLQASPAGSAGVNAVGTLALATPEGGLSGQYSRRSAAAVANSECGHYSNFASWARLLNAPTFRIYIRTGAVITNARFIIALGALNTLTDDNLNSGANNACGIRFSSSAGDVSWTTVARTTAGALTTNATGIVPAINTEYMMEIRASATLCRFHVFDLTNNTQQIVTHANPFGANTFVNGSCLALCRTLTASAKDLDTNRALFYYANDKAQPYTAL